MIIFAKTSWDNYRTFFEDFEEVYLFGIKVIAVLKNI